MKYPNQKYMITVVLFIVCLLAVTSCSMSPTYYSEREIKNYVKNVFGKEYKLTKTDADKHQYTFQNGEGFSFTMTTYTYNIDFDASETAFYGKGLRSDYTERVLEYHADEIRELLDNYRLNVDTSDSYYKIHIEDADEFEPLSDFISKLDHMLAYSFNNDKIPAALSEYEALPLSINIYFGDIEMSTIKLSSDDDERMEAQQVYANIEENYVNGVKAGEIDAVINKELWDKYPANRIDTVYINGEPLNTDSYNLFTLYYQEDLGTYSIVDLDPFEIFEDTSYSYKAGPLAYLVKRLGGAHSSTDWRNAVWTVDSVTWEATLHTSEKNGKTVRDYVEVSRNGKKLKLTDSSTYGSKENSPGDSYTIEDLELMLDLEIEIDQTKLAAYIIQK